MSTVAEQLRTAREAQKLSVHQLADITKIRTDHIRALEEGNFGVFSAPVYIRGFVRSCATLLKLDVPQVMATLDAELGQTEKFREPPALSPAYRGPLDFLMLQLSKVNWRKGLTALGAVALLVAIVSGYSAWRSRRAADPLAGLKPAIYEPNQGASGDMLPLPPTPAPKP
jgi:cytoskeleton protein RodZ